MGHLLFSSNRIFLELTIFAVSLFLCALTAFLETAITALRLFKIKKLAQTRKKQKKIINLLENNQTRILSTILIVKNLADVTAAAFGTDIILKLLAPMPKSVTICLGITSITALILIFGEITPKIFAKKYGESLIGSFLWIITLIYYSFYPFVHCLIPKTYLMIKKILKIPKSEKEVSSSTSEEEIIFLIESLEMEKLAEPEKMIILKNTFNLEKKCVKDIMTPNESIVSLDANSSIEKASLTFSKTLFSKIPVYVDNRSNIVGVISLKEIISCKQKNKKFKLNGLAKPILFVPENISLNNLLKKFEQQHKGPEIAIATDKSGNISGLVTLNDIVRKITERTLRKDKYKTDKTVEAISLRTEKQREIDSQK